MKIVCITTVVLGINVHVGVLAIGVYAVVAGWPMVTTSHVAVAMGQRPTSAVAAE